LTAGALVAGGAYLLWRRDHEPDPSKETKVVLLGETGSPAHHRVLVADKKVEVIPAAPDRPFSCRAERTCLLELHPEVKSNRFRLQAEVLLGQGGKRKEAGIFLAHARYPAADGIYHSFWSLGFKETPSEFEAIARTLAPCRVEESPPFSEHALPVELKRPYLPVNQGGQPGLWRKLTVELTDRELRAYWGEDELLTAEPLLAVQQRSKNVFAGTQVVDPAFTPQGSVGVYLDDVHASFRNVLLTLLP
jgi:hypothetical protein